jgi:hypothetical protein
MILSNHTDEADAVYLRQVPNPFRLVLPCLACCDELPMGVNHVGLRHTAGYPAE